MRIWTCCSHNARPESFKFLGAKSCQPLGILWDCGCRLINEPIQHPIIESFVHSSFNLSSSTILAGSFLASCSLNVLKFLPWSEYVWVLQEYHRISPLGNTRQFHSKALLVCVENYEKKSCSKLREVSSQRGTERERERGFLAGPWVFGDFLAKGILAGYDASMKLAEISQGSIRSSIRVDPIALEEKSKVMEDTEGPWRPMCLESILNDTNTPCNVSVSQVGTNYVAERSSKFTFAASSGGTSQSSQRWGFQTFQRCSQNFTDHGALMLGAWIGRSARMESLPLDLFTVHLPSCCVGGAKFQHILN